MGGGGRGPQHPKFSRALVGPSSLLERHEILNLEYILFTANDYVVHCIYKWHTSLLEKDIFWDNFSGVRPRTPNPLSLDLSKSKNYGPQDLAYRKCLYLKIRGMADAAEIAVHMALDSISYLLIFKKENFYIA